MRIAVAAALLIASLSCHGQTSIFIGGARGEEYATNFHIGAGVKIGRGFSAELAYVSERGPEEVRYVFEPELLVCPPAIACTPHPAGYRSEHYQTAAHGIGVSLLWSTRIAEELTGIAKAGYYKMKAEGVYSDRFVPGVGVQYGNPREVALRLMIERNQVLMGTLAFVYEF